MSKNFIKKKSNPSFTTKMNQLLKTHKKIERYLTIPSLPASQNEILKL